MKSVVSNTSNVWNNDLYQLIQCILSKDGLGYHDDGEENYNSDDSQTVQKRQRSMATAALTKEALKKARKIKALRAQSSNNTHPDGEVDSSGGKNKSMWDFIQKGASAAALPSKPPVRADMRATDVAAGGSRNRGLDSLLDELDDVGMTNQQMSSRKRRGNRLSSSRYGGHSPNRTNMTPKRRYGNVQRHNVKEHCYRRSSTDLDGTFARKKMRRDDDEYDHQYDSDNHFGHDDVDDDAHVTPLKLDMRKDESGTNENEDSDTTMADVPPTTANLRYDGETAERKVSFTEKEPNEDNHSSGSTKITQDSEADSEEEKKEKSETVAPTAGRRKRLTSDRNRITAAKKAAQEREKAEAAAKLKELGNNSTDTAKNNTIDPTVMFI